MGGGGVSFGSRHPQLLGSVGCVHLGDDLLEGEVTRGHAVVLVLLRQYFFVQINPILRRTEIMDQLTHGSKSLPRI